MTKIEVILKTATLYEQNCYTTICKVAFIRKLPNGKYRVLSEKGKNLGTFSTRQLAEKRLKQIEYFKKLDKSDADDESIDLTDIDDFSLSAIMRKLRKRVSKEQVMTFLKLFKKCFDTAIKDKLQKPDKIALQNALVKFNKLNKIKLNKKIIKNATVSELGDPKLVGKYLADIIRFTLNRISPDKRLNAINSLKNKIYQLNEKDLSMKNLPPTASMGQSITFIKHVLFNHDAQYIREVLNNIVRNL